MSPDERLRALDDVLGELAKLRDSCGDSDLTARAGWWQAIRKAEHAVSSLVVARLDELDRGGS